MTQWIVQALEKVPLAVIEASFQKLYLDKWVEPSPPKEQLMQAYRALRASDTGILDAITVGETVILALTSSCANCSGDRHDT